MKKNQTIRNPLQLMGFYIIWIESVAGITQFALQNYDRWSKSFLIISMAIGILLYIFSSSFVIIWLTIKQPQLLFNPSDYDKNVQQFLFPESTKSINIANPPNEVEGISIPTNPRST